MEYEWIYRQDLSQRIKFFVKELGVSKSLLAKIKFQGGQILVNGQEQNVLYLLRKGDRLKLIVPPEAEEKNILLDPTPLEIVSEDQHFLIVNKPSRTPSIPAYNHPNGTMANRVKNYFIQQNYENKTIHVVTRLDKDTTGLMLFAKSSFAHSLLDTELRQHRVYKEYLAIAGGNLDQLSNHGRIDLPIARDANSIIKRCVSQQGKRAITEYQVLQRNNFGVLLKINLLTGRTHQIRVHLTKLNCPLLGDNLYGGDCTLGIQRQALHCAKLRFYHPFLKQEVEFNQELPPDMRETWRILNERSRITRERKKL